jgi:riboflavin biosynthesis pyrimidine reductase
LRYDISALLLEGGAVIHAAAWQADVIDRVHIIVAPTTIGEGGVRLFDGIDLPPSRLAQVMTEQLGPDTWMEADVHRHH